MHYDDLSTHRFRGDEFAAAELLRYANFLETQLPYVWRQPHWTIRIVAWVLGLVTLGLIYKLFWMPPPAYWPFPSAEAEQSTSA